MCEVAWWAVFARANLTQHCVGDLPLLCVPLHLDSIKIAACSVAHHVHAMHGLYKYTVQPIPKSRVLVLTDLCRF